MVEGADMPMAGRPSGKTRYYANRRTLSTPGSDIPFASIQADIVEAAVLDAVSAAIGNGPLVEKIVRDTLVAVKLEQKCEKKIDRNALVSRREKLIKKIEVISEANSELGVAVVRRLTQTHKDEVLEINMALEAVLNQDQTPLDVDRECRRAIKFLQELSRSITCGGTESGVVRNVLRLLIQSLTFDVRNRVVKLALYIPSWNVLAEQMSSDMRLVSTKTALAADKTHSRCSALLGVYKGTYVLGNRWEKSALKLKMGR